jgi:hypothetical protein
MDAIAVTGSNTAAIRARRSIATFTRIRSFPFCIDFLPDGRLLVVNADDQLLLRMEPDGSLVTHADLSGLSDCKWNDIAMDGRGNAYVNNIGFDFPGGGFAPGIVALISPDGSVRQVADGVSFPNGTAVTPDSSTLIVAESYASRLTAFEIATDGDLSNRRVWADLGDRAPDGICLDGKTPSGRGRPQQTMCARSRRRRGIADDRVGSWLFRVPPGKPRLANAVHDRNGVAGSREHGRGSTNRTGARGRGPGIGCRPGPPMTIARCLNVLRATTRAGTRSC